MTKWRPRSRHALLRRDTSSLADRKAELAGVTGALEALDKYAPVKKGLFTKRRPISEAEFFQAEAKADALRCTEAINECTREISRLYAAENKLNANLASLLPWASLGSPPGVSGHQPHPVYPGDSPPPQWSFSPCRMTCARPQIWRN